MGANAGLGILAVLGVASILTTVTFLQLEAWAPTWEAWLAAAPPQGAGYSGDRLQYFKHLPTFMVGAMIAVVLAMASPVALRIGR